MSFPAADVVELNQLAYRYAAGVDRCDAALFTSCFTPEARLRAYQVGEETPFIDFTGPGQMAAIPESMRGQYHSTTHMMTNHLVEIDGDSATGEVLCMARHCLKDGTASLNVVIRYHDRYRRGETGWLIEDREIRFQWNERHEVADALLGGG
jgi:hypothetical protein